MSLSLGFSSWLVSFLREDSSNLLPKGEGLTASILRITEKRVLGNSSFTLQEAVAQSPFLVKYPCASPQSRHNWLSSLQRRKVYCQGRDEAVTQ